MNISTKFLTKILALGSVFLFSLSAKAADQITIDGVTYTKHTAYACNDPIPFTLGEDGQNHYYEFIESNILMNQGGGPAITIKGNVVIGVYKTLNVRGGDAKGYLGAGAGIYVPKGASLRIMPSQGQSSCTVTAYGGNAGQPNVRIYGEDRFMQYNNGAGGAAAGIGANGGNGGRAIDVFDNAGNYSYANYGKPSEQCGNIFIDKGVTLTAVGGRGTGVEHTDNGKTVYNFDLVGAESSPKNYGYNAAGVKKGSWLTLEVDTQTAHYTGDTWGGPYAAYGSPGGQGGGGGGYPAAGIGGGGSGGGAGGFGSLGSSETGKATSASGHGGHGGGGGTGYGYAGQFGISGGYAKFQYGWTTPIISAAGAEYKEAGEYLTSSGLYTGRNGYWGQKNFSGKGHAEEETGSRQLNGVRPGSYLDGGNGGELVSGSPVSEPGIGGGGVLFDSRSGEITIRGNVTSLGNGGHQPKQFETIGSVTYNYPNKPYYINDIGTALNGEYNPVNVIVENGTLSTNRQDGLTMTDANNFSAKEYTVTIGKYMGGIDGYILMQFPPEKKTFRLSGVQHFREVYGSSAIYVSYNGLTPGQERFTYVYPRPDNRNAIHTNGMSVAERYYADKNLPSADWEYTKELTWKTITNPSQSDYAFNGRYDINSSEDRLGIFFFDADIKSGTLEIGDKSYTSNGWKNFALITNSNSFQARYHRNSADGYAEMKWMNWKPLNFSFCGTGGTNYELMEVGLSDLPKFKNNNTDNSSIFGFYTEKAVVNDGTIQINGQTFTTLEELARNSQDSIYVVTWNPTIELVSEESRENIAVKVDDACGAWYPDKSGNNRMMAKLAYNHYLTIPSMYLCTDFDTPSILRFTYKGCLYVDMEEGSRQSFTSDDWEQAIITIPAGNQTVRFQSYSGISYIYDISEVRTLPQDANGNFIIRTSEDLDAATKLVKKSGGSAFHFRVIGEVETSADFEPFGSSMASPFVGSMNGGTIKLTNNKPLIYITENAVFSDMTVIGDLVSNGPMDQDLVFFAYTTNNVKFINCKVTGSLNMNKNRGLSLNGFTVEAVRTEFSGCVVDAQMIGYAFPWTYYDYDEDKDVTVTKMPNMSGFAAGFKLEDDEYGMKFTDCSFIGEIYSIDDEGNVYPGQPFGICPAESDYDNNFVVTNCISTYNPQCEKLPNTTAVNTFVLADTDKDMSNYSTKTAEQFASGEVGNLLANNGRSHWYTPNNSKYPVYDPNKFYNHARIIAGENLVLTKGTPATVHKVKSLSPENSTSDSPKLHLHEGDEFTVSHIANQECLLYVNNEFVSNTGTYTGTAPAGETLITMKELAKAGDKIEVGSLRYVILTTQDGEEYGTVKTLPGTGDSYGNTDLTGNVVIPSVVQYEGSLYYVTGIGDYSLAGSGVTSVELPATLTAIGTSGLGGLTGIEDIKIPNNVESLGSGIFKGCSNLKSVTFANDIQITEIPQSAFEGTAITSINVPESVTSIGDNAFFNCNDLKTVTLPAGLTSLGESAFGETPNLKTIIYLTDDPVSASESAFSDYTAPTLYALLSEKDKYEDIEPWNKFTNTTWCGVHLNPTEIDLIISRSAQLSANVVVAPGEMPQDIVWSSSDPNIVQVDNDGKVKAIDCGLATVSADAGPYRNECEVTVYDFTTGINEILGDDTKQVDIFNLQGVCLKRNASAEDIRALAPGLYIIGDKKVLIRE